MNDRPAVPTWVIAVWLLAGAGAILLLSLGKVLPPVELSWPLFLVLFGGAFLLAAPRRFLVVGGGLAVLGALFYMHNVEWLPLRTNWPWLLIALAALIVLDRVLEKGAAGVSSGS